MLIKSHLKNVYCLLETPEIQSPRGGRSCPAMHFYKESLVVEGYMQPDQGGGMRRTEGLLEERPDEDLVPPPVVCGKFSE